MRTIAIASTCLALLFAGDMMGKAPQMGDFNGDGRGDVLWRHTGTGEVGAWLLDGATIIGAGSIGAAPAEMSIVGIGDFDGNGRSDILWRHDDGEVGVWLLDGLAIVGAGSLGTIPQSIAGVGDFDGDGRDDLLWRDGPTNTAGVCFMNGAAISSCALAGGLNSSLTVLGTEDFDNDGKDDVFWIGDPADHCWSNWLMDGATIKFSRRIGCETNLTLAGVGDFNGDGYGDLLWHELPRRVVVYIGSTGPNNFVLHDIWYLSDDLPAGVTVEGVAQIGGDARSDIVFHDTDGNVGIWIVGEESITSGSLVGSAPLEYQIQTGSNDG